MASVIWLIRHGETEWSRWGQHTGRTDIPLTDEGRKVATRLSGAVGGHAFARVWSSPLSRARETCALAGLGARVELKDALMEWDYGTYEGKTTPNPQGEPDLVALDRRRAERRVSRGHRGTGRRRRARAHVARGGHGALRARSLPARSGDEMDGVARADGAKARAGHGVDQQARLRADRSASFVCGTATPTSSPPRASRGRSAVEPREPLARRRGVATAER